MQVLPSLVALLILAAPAWNHAEDYKTSVRPNGGDKRSLVVEVPPGYEVAETSRRRVRLVRTDKTVARREQIRAISGVIDKPILAPWAPNAPGG